MAIDIDDALQKIKAAGGTICQSGIQDFQRFGSVADAFNRLDIHTDILFAAGLLSERGSGDSRQQHRDLEAFMGYGGDTQNMGYRAEQCIAIILGLVDA